MKFQKVFALFLVVVFLTACSGEYESPQDKFYEVTANISTVVIQEDKLLKEFRIYFDGLEDGSAEAIDAKFLEFSLIEFRTSVENVENLIEDVDIFAQENSQEIKDYYESEYAPFVEDYLAFIDRVYNELLEGDVDSEEIEEMKEKFITYTEDFYFISTGLTSEIVDSYFNISVLNLP